MINSASSVPFVQKVDQPIYDTVQLPAAAGVFPFFTVPLGGALTAAIAKTYAHTNLRRAGQLEEGQSFTIYGLTMDVREIAAGGARPTFVDYQAIQLGWLELWYEDRVQMRFQAVHIPNSAGALQYASNIAAAATEYKVTRGVPAFGNIYPLREPLVIGNNSNFRVDYTVGAMGAVTDLTITLHGVLTRNVA